MYNLIVKGGEWSTSRDSISASRVFEHTESGLKERFKPEGRLDFDSLLALPTLFVKETFRDDPVVHIGYLRQARVSGSNIMLEYSFEATCPSLTNSVLQGIAAELDIDGFEFSRTHWAVKGVDLFQVLFRNVQSRRLTSGVFQLNDPEIIEPDLISLMMPFDLSFNGVATALKDVARDCGYRCQRADDIWEHSTVIQDIVTLIDKSNIVICDCTGKNPNVFYETGIAHTLGREVILITQSDDDIPFDLRHHRYVKYLNNGEGLDRLKTDLEPRLSVLASR